MVIKRAKEILKIEAEAIENLISRIDDNFQKAVDTLFNCKGKVVVTGMGKSGLIGKKIAATLASTGTPAIFLHPAEGIHGDLGMMSKGDVMIAISHSGGTKEIALLLPAVKRFGIKLIVLTGDINSPLAKESDIVLDISVSREACPFGLVPTSSTTATLALGDALAITLLEKRGLKEEDFAFRHPGGSLGKKLLKVSDLMHKGAEIPAVHKNTSLRDTLGEMSLKRLGVTAVVNKDNILLGVITDGDLRRFLEKSFESPRDLGKLKAKDVMTENAKTIKKEELAERALKIMEDNAITSLIILDKKKKPEGIVHMHDLMRAGVV